MKTPPYIPGVLPETMVLEADSQEAFAALIPLMTPVATHEREGCRLVRWQMPIDLALRVGLDKPRCATPGCGCTSIIEYQSGYVVDIDWDMLAWYFHPTPPEWADD